MKGIEKDHTHELLFLICGPTASGKNTLIEQLKAYCQEHNREFYFSVSATTRQPRPGEINGTHYHFFSPEEFDKKISEGFLLEHEDVHGKMYGTPRLALYEHLDRGSVCAADIDIHGAKRIVEAMKKDGRPEPVTVYIYVENDDDIRNRFLKRFGVTKETATEEQLKDMEHRITRKTMEDKDRLSFKYVINSGSKAEDAAVFADILKNTVQ